MVVIAVAGGSGGLGRALVEGIQARGNHEVVVLSRKANPALEAERGVRFVPIDYSDVEAATRVLEENNIHTIVSALSFMPGNGDNYEDRLALAADASGPTKRFIASNWALGHPENRIVTCSDPMPIAAAKDRIVDVLRASKTLEYTEVRTGYFLDYFGMPKVKSYLTPFVIVLDIAHNAAAIPGTGNDRVSFTHTRDVGRYVAALLDVEKWETETTVVAETLTWNEFLALAEEVKGTKFEVTYDGPELYNNGKTGELPTHKQMYPFFPKEMLQGMASAFNLTFVRGIADLSGGVTHNAQLDEIKPWSAKDVLEMAWKA
ncbi:uncharacterized protein B0I36DRAFT_296210 [Microdochium trichocladiopsis]|uniref:NmrA-like domain-containing protein n=1 Tax=Microdochium trichocladiopsis TaxID=1682393 RepID=A0A9P8XXD5_9PEZI|nr:uncharacterized protein B0I36DRAFT_296210 [Microdochium trichocladiopsis]KAH7020775.1 hypothetical protein B0I36DRAFT_296210 [Microdochium trichocladiopsis]